MFIQEMAGTCAMILLLGETTVHPTLQASKQAMELTLFENDAMMILHNAPDQPHYRGEGFIM